MEINTSDNSDPVQNENWDSLREKIIGLGDRSLRKSYYPELNERLRELERFRTLLDQINDMIFVLQLDPLSSPQKICLVDINHTACRMLGYQRHELLGTDKIRIFSENIFRQTSMGTVQLYKKNGEILQSEMSLRVVEQDERRYAVVVARDVTERIRAQEKEAFLEKQLRQVQKLEAIGTLAGGIAHDFNNILMPIIGFTELSLHSLSRESKVHEHLQKVLEAAQRARSIIHQILSFSRSGEHHRKPVTITSIAKEVLKLLRASISTTIDIRQEILISEDQAIVMADSTQIYQVLVNLCINAAQAMHGKVGTLTLRIAIDKDQFLRIEVQDTGPGIPHELQEKIFEPFFTTRSEQGGTGLGLSVAQSIVQHHGGYISLLSEPGVGATFRVLLPRTLVSDIAVQKKEASIPLGKERILFVDDEQSISELVREYLSSLGYQVDLARNGIEALNLLENSYDLVITDQSMPQMKGTDLAQELHKRCMNLPIILFTGYADLETKQTAESLAINKILYKPLKIQELGAEVRKILDLKSVK